MRYIIVRFNPYMGFQFVNSKAKSRQIADTEAKQMKTDGTKTSVLEVANCETNRKLTCKERWMGKLDR